MENDDLKLLFELFEDTPRQGPGSVETTRRALRLLPESLKVERVLDLGCGSGGSTLVLAEETGAQQAEVYGVDDAVVVEVSVAQIAESIAVCVGLCGVLIERAVVGRVDNAIVVAIG